MQNQRKHERVQKKIKSQVEGSEILTYSSSQDVSNSGIFITTPDPITPGTELDLSLKLPDGETVQVRGIVRWTKDEDSTGSRAGMGIEFTNIDAATQEKIKKQI